jgi:hypothetical protein
VSIFDGVVSRAYGMLSSSCYISGEIDAMFSVAILLIVFLHFINSFAMRVLDVLT